jgi:hypothetical protein
MRVRSRPELQGQAPEQKGHGHSNPRMLGAPVNNNHSTKKRKLCLSITLRRRSDLYVFFQAIKLCFLHELLVFTPLYSTAVGSLKREAETCTSVFRSRGGQCSAGLTSTSTQIHNSISLRPQALRSRSALAEPRLIVRSFICNAGAG